MNSPFSTAPLGGAPGTDAADLSESVAGEEDPGAAIDIDRASQDAAEVRGGEPGTGAPPGRAGAGPARAAAGPGAPHVQGVSAPAVPRMKPGDEAPEGAPGTGEDLCPDCGGSGRQDGKPCPTCEGTGKVNVGIGGA